MLGRMGTLNFDTDYVATWVPYRTDIGFVAKGTVFRKDKPVEIFEATGHTLPATEEAAQAKAEEICKRLKAAKLAKGRAAMKRSK